MGIGQISKRTKIVCTHTSQYRSAGYPARSHSHRNLRRLPAGANSVRIHQPSTITHVLRQTVHQRCVPVMRQHIGTSFASGTEGHHRRYQCRNRGGVHQENGLRRPVQCQTIPQHHFEAHGVIRHPCTEGQIVAAATQVHIAACVHDDTKLGWQPGRRLGVQQIRHHGHRGPNVEHLRGIDARQWTAHHIDPGVTVTVGPHCPGVGEHHSGAIDIAR